MERRFENQISALVEQKLKFTRLSAFFGASIPLLSALGFIVVIWYGSWLVIQHELTLGALVSFLLYLTLLRQPLEQLGNMLNTVQRASASLSRIADLLAVMPDTVERPAAAGVPAVQGFIEVRNLTFRYPVAATDSLRDVSFRLAPGQTLGVVGSIGSGKTTLAHLLLRLYEPPAGTIFIDGRDILDFPLAPLRRAIAYVPQNSFLFSTTVRGNIAFSEDSTPDEQQTRHAAEVAAVDADIQKFAGGYDTEIGERGVRLSGGQKQRMAIARMIYKDAPIRVLDDSLSAVDTAVWLTVTLSCEPSCCAVALPWPTVRPAGFANNRSTRERVNTSAAMLKEWDLAADLFMIGFKTGRQLKNIPGRTRLWWSACRSAPTPGSSAHPHARRW